MHEALLAEGRRRGGPPLPLVFSSTCASYGIPDPNQIPIAETCPQRPINPYGRSKWMVEQLIADFAAAYGLPSVIAISMPQVPIPLTTWAKTTPPKPT